MDVPKNFVRLRGSFYGPAKGFVRAEEIVPEYQLEVTVRVRRRPDAPPLILPKVRDKGRKRLEPKTFASRYGASAEDLDILTKYGKDNGLDPVSTEEYGASNAAMRAQKFRGPAKAFRQAFAVSLARYVSKTGEGESYIGREGWIYLPSEKGLDKIVTGVFGLDMRPIGVCEPTISFLSVTAPPTPPNLAMRYNFPAHNATGETIALMEFGGGFYPADIKAWFDNLGLPVPDIKLVGIDGAYNQPGINSTWDREVASNICIAGSVAQGATLVVYFAPHTEQGWTNAISACVTSEAYPPTVISLSWGAAELKSSNSLFWTENGIVDIAAFFAEAALPERSITVLAASGNHGSSGRYFDGRAHVAYPASDPHVIACGGTSIKTFAAPWTEKALPRSGGGISRVFEAPTYQTDNVALPPSVNNGQVKLGVPDIAGYASPGYAFIYQGAWFQAAGTSLVAPLYAALIARINAYIGAPQGFIHEALYTCAGTPLCAAGLLDDMVGGLSNSYPGPPTWSPGYNCTVGWDGITGLGVIDGQKLLALLQAT